MTRKALLSAPALLGAVALLATMLVTMLAVFAGPAEATLSPSTTFTLSKTARFNELTAGATANFTITATNTGQSAGTEVVICDTPGVSLRLITAPGAPGSSGESPCWSVASWPAGETRTYHVDTVLNISAVGTVQNTALFTAANASPVSSTADITIQPDSGNGKGDHVTTNNVEEQVSLAAGQKLPVVLACPGSSGEYMTDGGSRIEAVDQGTGTLTSVQVLASHTVSPQSREYVFLNTASGRAQAKVFGVCVPDQTVEHHHPITLTEEQSASNTWAPGAHVVDLKCGTNQVPVAPGYEFSSGYGTVTYSEPDNNDGWEIGVNVISTASVKLSIRCLNVWDSAVDGVANGESQQLIFSHHSVGATVQAGETKEVQVTCGQEAKGIVSSTTLSPGLLTLGDEAQGKTRVFQIYNPTSAPLNATMDLICLGDRTSANYLRKHRTHHGDRFEANYTDEPYYGAVHCVGRRLVNSTYPNGKEWEWCESTTGHPLLNMPAGAKDQHSFLATGGGYAGGWESDDIKGEITTNFTYSVSSNGYKFWIVAIY